MLKVITLNVNGLRSAEKKGLFPWLVAQNADVICLQEVRAHPEQIKGDAFRLAGYTHYFCDAEKKGYSGVAIFTRHTPIKVSTGLGWPIADTEGRYIQIDFAELSIASLYMPSGTSGAERQQHKYEFMALYMAQLRDIVASGRDFIISGDWNIAHRQIDLKNWRSNQKNSGFLPEERAWLDTLFDQVGMVDAFRVVNQAPDQYTWWSNRGQAYANNVGWRIDYQIVTPSLRNNILSAAIDKTQKFSDHAPLIMEYDYIL